METTPRSESTHLWEHDHPYYCSEGCYYVPGTRWSEVHADWESWQDFLEDWGNVDPDYNLLFRWDWEQADPQNFYLKPGDPDDETAEYEEAKKVDTLKLFFYLQRKAKPFSHTIRVTEADEESVRAWLTGRAEHMRTLWAPLLGEADSDV